MSKFKRELRYLVIKHKDAARYLTQTEQRILNTIAERVLEGRCLDNKHDLECVVVEHDWPEYEMAWDAIESRMTTKQDK